jgi:hypothetical protein
VRVAALLICDHIDQQWNQVDFRGVPKSIFEVSSFPARLVVPVVAVVWSEPGEDSEAEIQIQCLTTKLELLGGQTNKWKWPDQEGILTKYHVFTHGVEIIVDYEGLYYIGLAGAAVAAAGMYVPFQVKLQQGFDAVQDPFVVSEIPPHS